MAINTKMINVRIERYKERRRSGGRNMESERDRERERGEEERGRYIELVEIERYRHIYT